MWPGEYFYCNYFPEWFISYIYITPLITARCSSRACFYVFYFYVLFSTLITLLFHPFHKSPRPFLRFVSVIFLSPESSPWLYTLLMCWNFSSARQFYIVRDQWWSLKGSQSHLLQSHFSSGINDGRLLELFSLVFSQEPFSKFDKQMTPNEKKSACGWQTPAAETHSTALGDFSSS